MFQKSIQSQWRILFSVLSFVLFPYLLVAQMWSDVEESEIPVVGTRYIQPSKYRTLKLDVAQMKIALNKAPMTKTPAVKNNPAFLDIPWPDGSMKTFQIIESPIMEPELMAKFPEIKTYAGSEVGNGANYIRLDLTPQGFHAMILTGDEGTIYIDPYTFGGGDITHYIAYNKKDFKPIASKQMVCGVRGNPINTDDYKPSTGGSMYRFGSCELRVYRIAIAATGEYTTFHGGTVALAQAAQVTTMNRVNGVYLRDMAVRMDIIGNNNLLIYTNAATDPYTNGSPGAMINENQTNVDNVIGSANYDIGHVFGTNSGGLAGLGVICSNSGKARGVTGSGAPINDPFDIDYVAHELGHQFGANHTFNNSCGGNRNNATAMEPGSGSTIMAYAGICPPNIQSNSDDHFHGASLEEMSNRILSTNCPVTTALANNPPNITGTNAGVTVPGSTPFALTAVANDPDGNTLTYCWEQMNNAIATMPPQATSNDGPNFRSFSPSTSPTRYFPNLTDLAAGNATTWEVLATVNRTMNFRVSVRDNAVGGGCTDHTDVVLNVDGNSGPFIVTYPSAAGISWTGATNETVTWDVANTDVAPVACANVDILLSTDGGLTYPTVLANNVPNDGNQQITVPNTATTTARIMVVCENGTFFDISDNNFTIVAATLDYTLGATSDTATACQPANATYTINVGQIGSYTDPVTLSLTGVPAGATATFGTNPVTPAGTTTLTISNTGAAAAGAYNLTLTGNSTSGTKNYALVLNIGGVPGTVTPTAPANAATNVATPTNFTWNGSGTAGEQYQIEIATDAGFTNIVDNANNLSTASYTSSSLSLGTAYFWRVRALNPCGTGPYSTTFSFTTGSCGTFMSTDVPKTISSTSTSTVTSTLNIPITGTITDVNVVNLAGTHSYINDLIVSLASPAATSVTLWSQICNAEDDFNVNFDDGAASATLPCPPTGGGTYQPNGSLANYNGQNPNGNWTLSIQDVFAQDGGALNSWGLEVCVATTPTCTGSATVTNVSCNGGNNGTATAVGGGTAPYTYAWSNGQNTATATGLTAATYTVTITDNNNCTATATAVVTAPTALTANNSTTAETCANNDGTATATATGGTAPYTYAWSNGQNTATATGLTAATYTATITDANNCTTTTTATVADGCNGNCPLNIAIAFTTSVSCNGGNDGTARATVVSGGVFPYNISWSNGQTNILATGLAAGNYTVTITDANNCTASVPAVVTEPAVLAATANTTAETCANNDGTATATATGGTAPYTYAWSNGQNTATATGLTAATYTATITDANNCTTTTSATVADSCVGNCPLNIAIAFTTSVSCNGGNDGTARATVVSGGVFPYTINWSNGQTNILATGLTAGTYTVTITDANNCVGSVSAVVTEPAALTSGTTGSTLTCGNHTTGTATVNVTGGTTPYNYAWSNGQNAATATGLTAATYTVTVTDNNGCITNATAVVSGPPALTATTTATTIDCPGGVGSATVAGSGGVMPYNYVWNNGQTTTTATGLFATTYTVTITDNNNCSVTDNITLTDPAPIVVSSSVVSNFNGTSVSCNGGSDGSAMVTVTGGTAPYTYLWNPSGEVTQTATGLEAGNYTIIVTDANNCATTGTVTLTEPTAMAATAVDNGNATATATATGGVAPYTYQWGATANNQTTPTATGLVNNTIYTVTITDANGCTATANVTVNITNIDNIPNLSLFDVRPNPNTGRFHIRVQFATAKEATIRLTNVLGQVLKEHNMSGATSDIPVDIQEQASGVYFVILQTDQQSVTRKVIVSK